MRHDASGRTPDRVGARPTWLLSRVFARSSALLMAGFEAHGDGLRGYHFRLLALSTDHLRAQANASCPDIEREARESTVAEAILVGWYER